jgi:hypothetical protein
MIYDGRCTAVSLAIKIWMEREEGMILIHSRPR